MPSNERKRRASFDFGMSRMATLRDRHVMSCDLFFLLLPFFVQAEKVRLGESSLIRAASKAYADPSAFLSSLRLLKKDMHQLLKMQEMGGLHVVTRTTTTTADETGKSSSALSLQLAKFLLVCRMLPLTFFSFVVFIHRYHLFIWSVFAPKLLFESMNFLVVALFSVAVGTLSRLNG